MSLLVLCYPEINENDYKWIQSIRSKYGRGNLAKVEPHITAVFPVKGVAQEKFIEHVTSIITTSKSIDIVLDHFEVLWDKNNPSGYLCLMPNAGRVELIGLYNNLYTGILENKKGFNEEFKPHMTVGVFDDKTECLNTAEN